MRAKEDGRAGQHADALAVTNGRRMTISIVANRAESAREDVTKIAPDEFGPGNRFGFELVVGAILPKKGDGAAGDRNDPAVRNHTAGDVVAKIANGMGAGTGRLNVNAPVFGPDGGINLPHLECWASPHPARQRFRAGHRGRWARKHSPCNVARGILTHADSSAYRVIPVSFLYR